MYEHALQLTVIDDVQIIHAQEAELEKELADKMEEKRVELVRVADEEYEKKR
jgi:hypothetical protein